MWSTRRGPNNNGVFLGSLRQGGQQQLSWMSVTAASKKHELEGGSATGHGNVRSSRGSHGFWDHNAAPELTDLKTQLYVPKPKDPTEYVHQRSRAFDREHRPAV